MLFCGLRTNALMDKLLFVRGFIVYALMYTFLFVYACTVGALIDQFGFVCGFRANSLINMACIASHPNLGSLVFRKMFSSHI